MILAKILINAGERFLLTRQPSAYLGYRSCELSTDRVYLILMQRLGKKSGRAELEVVLPVESLRELSAALAAGVAARVSLGEGRYFVTAPLPRRALRIAFIESGKREKVRRIFRLGPPQRRQLEIAIEHARAALHDPTLIEELLLKAERGTRA